MSSQITLASGVYFIYAPNQNKIKIGRSKNIERRYKQLRTGFMDKGILLIGILSEDEVSLETDLHRRFSHLRETREWFTVTKELKDFVSNCHLEYENVIHYNNLSEIQNKLTYNSLGMFKLVVGFKNFHNKYLIPLFLAIIGFIIAYYYYKFGLLYSDNQILHVISYFLLFFYPILTPILSRLIIKYESVLTGIIFFSILFITFFIEILNLIIGIQNNILIIFRIFLLSVYMALTKNILIIISAKMTSENLQMNVQDKFRTKLSQIDNINELNNLLDKKKWQVYKINKKRRKIVYTSASIAYLATNVYLLFNEYSFAFNLWFLMIINIGVVLWLIWPIINKYLINGLKFRKLRKNIIPFTVFFVLVRSIVFPNSINVFFALSAIFIIGLLPVIIIWSATLIPKRRYELQIEEINDKINNFYLNE